MFKVEVDAPKSWHIVKHWWSTEPGCFEYFSIFADRLDPNESIFLYSEDEDEDPGVLYDGDYVVIASGFDELTALNYIVTDMPAEIGLYFSYPAID